GDSQPSAAGASSKASGHVSSPRGEEKKILAEIQQLTEKFRKCESRLQHFKKEKEKLYEEMAKNPFLNSKERNLKLKELESNIQEEKKQWLQIQEKIEKRNQELGA